MILLDPSHDRFHGLDLPGSWEWSYFDGLSDDGRNGFVAIWFRGCPMSPNYTAAIDRGRSDALPARYCAFSFSLYRDGKRVFSNLVEGDEGGGEAGVFSGSTTGPDIRFAGNTVHGSTAGDGTTAFYVRLDTRSSSGSRRAIGEIEMTFPTHEMPSTGSFDPARHPLYWVPAAPSGSFKAAIDLLRVGRASEKVRFSGGAYHDRNLGAIPLHHLDVDWNWGRLHAGGKAFVFFEVLPRNGSSEGIFRRMLAYDRSGLLLDTDDFAIESKGRTGHWGTLPYHRRLSARVGEGVRFSSEIVSLLDSGPFYHRMLSRIEVAGNGIDVSGPGMTEYLRPKRLGVGVFRPFVRFRVRRKKG